MKSVSSKKTTQNQENILSETFPIVGIGASAGGLEAFSNLIKSIPANTGMAYVLVQHLDPNHESLLTELLQKVSIIPVTEVSDNIKIEPDHIYVIPSNKIMVISDGCLQLTPRPKPNRKDRNLPIDIFFTSLATEYQSLAIGVVLSGTASDGTIGLKMIKYNGGITFAQDEASASYQSMPLSAIEAGVVDFILPPEQISSKIIEITKQLESKEKFSQQDEEAFKQIILLLHIRKVTDFTYYKQTTIRRRVFRRMEINNISTPGAYLKYLKENQQEQDLLYQDLLIPVTEFFRDQTVFDNLDETVFSAIVANKTTHEPIRIWIAACSTGQEAYSIAICLKEFLGNKFRKVQIFATDISEPAIEKARSGIYTKSEVETLSPQLLQEFFTKTNGMYQVNKHIRDMCIFAVHNFLKDPPFRKVDFISCRNVLIYMEPYLQKKALTTFHYSLNPKGILLLGKTETTSTVAELFTPTVKSNKLFARKDMPSRFTPANNPVGARDFNEIIYKKEPVTTDFQKAADDIILRNHTPAGVIVNEALEIVHFRGATTNYLEQAPGKPNHHLLKMARQGLAFELRNMLHKVKKEKECLIKENIPFQINNYPHYISIEVTPLVNTVEPYYLVLFKETELPENRQLQPENKKSAGARTKIDRKDLHILHLEQELLQTREDMRIISQDQETTIEELQTANEELLSSSEELQSLNEELETSKEELQSINEELTVVNQEIIGLSEQITRAKEYAEAIIATVREPLIVLDKSLRIMSANLSYYQFFLVNEAETEGNLIYEVSNRQWDIPGLRLLLEKLIPEKSSFRNFEITYYSSTIGKRVLLLNASEIRSKNESEKLILLAIEDITQKRNEEELEKQSQKRFQFIADAMPQKVWTANVEGNLDYLNKSWLDYTGLSFEDLKNWGWKKIVHADDWEESKKQWLNSITTGNDYEVVHRLLNKTGQYKWHLTRGSAQKDDNKNILMWVGTNTEIEKQVKQKQVLEKEVYKRTHELEEANVSLLQKNEEIALSVYNKNFLKEFSDKFSSYTSNTEFFNLLVLYIAELTHLDYVLIAKLEETDRDTYDVVTIAISAFGNLTDNIRYPLLEGPCEQVIRSTGYSYPEKCQITFPKDKILGGFNIDGFIGYPLYNLQGIAIGLIAVMHQSKLKEPETVFSVLKIAAKRAEIEMERSNFEEQLAYNNQSLAQKNIELEKMNNELQAFTYVASHDLQEPLRKIQTFASRLLEKEIQNLSDKGKDYFTRIKSATERMQRLIIDLLAFSRLNTTEAKFEDTDLTDIVKEVQEELKERIEEKNATIEITKLCTTHVIRFQFRQLVYNLLSNAMKFSKPEVLPHIIITARTEKGAKFLLEDPNLPIDRYTAAKTYCHLRVTDNGIGFDMEFKDRIFEVFQRLNGQSEYDGTGIGLSIVKKIVQNHNGFIMATGKPEEGATFDIYIPQF